MRDDARTFKALHKITVAIGDARVTTDTSRHIVNVARITNGNGDPVQGLERSRIVAHGID
jgi:hypothetical protein